MRWCGALAALVAACASSPRATIETIEGHVVLDVGVTVARTAAERATGLRDRMLARGEGLAIEFPLEGEVCIVNSGVGYAIDVVFAASDGRIHEIARGVPAGDDEPRCVGAVRTVLEVQQGEAAPAVAGQILRITR